MRLNLRHFTIGTLAAVIASALFTGCKSDSISTAMKVDKMAGIPVPSIEQTKAIAKDGFIYGLPIVMNYAVMYEYCVDTNSSQYKGPFNTIFNEARVFTYKDTAVVTPNSDTPYSMLWLDLRAEPIVISVPAVETNRYYSVQLEDGNTFNYGYIGSRATGNEAGNYLVVGPGWQGATPLGIKKVFHATTQFGLTIFRMQLFDADDMTNVMKIQAGYQVQPLSAYLGQPAPPPAPAINFPPINRRSMRDYFFQYLEFAMQFAPAGPDEKLIRARLASIGIGVSAEKSFDLKDLDLEHKTEVGLGMREGDKKMGEYLDTKTKDINGWKIASLFGDRSFFHGDWLKRAAGASAGIYGNDVVEAMYPMTRNDSSGEPLDGSKHNYTLTFSAGEFPPVNAFWSVTMYDGKSQLLIQNPINRYLINSPMLPGMKKNDDGSLTIYIQHDSPGADKESNWLPAPNDTIYLIMRLYWPITNAPSILPAGEGTWKPPGVVQVN